MSSDVSAYLDTITDPRRRADADLLIGLIGGITGEPAVLWGTSIIGFGSRHYRYESGREGDTPLVSFAPRAAATVLYLTGGIEEYADLLANLGPHRTGKGCLYLKRVDGADGEALRAILTRSYRHG